MNRGTDSCLMLLMFDNSPPAFLEKIAIVLPEDGMVEQGTHDTLLER
ncbi:hypothetical protein ABLO26_11105 [Neobacillus sp. 179-J 1A1 HS]